MKIRRLWLILGIGLFPRFAAAQEPPILSPEDTAAVWAAAFDTLREESSPTFDADVLLWVRTAPYWDLTASNSPPSDRVWSGLLQRFPQAEYAEPAEDLIDCPPGVKLKMPGNGCPIRGGGRIIQFKTISSASSEDVRVRVYMVHSAADARWTQWFGMEVKVGWQSGSGWAAREIVWYLAT